MAPHWAWWNGPLGASTGLPKTSTFSKCSFELRARSRRKKKALPCQSLLPLFVTVFTVPPAAWPNSAGAEAARTWNSRTASWLNAAATAPVKASSLSKPSTITWLARARWPAKVRPEEAVGPVGGVRSATTAGLSREKATKSRPLAGSPSIERASVRAATAAPSLPSPVPS